jgi:hypothetical protein
MPEAFSLQCRPEQLEFCLNAVYYEVGSSRLIDQTGYGVRDIAQKFLRIPVAEELWPWWFHADPVFQYGKLFRFWHLLSKGYVSEPKTIRFLKLAAMSIFAVHSSRTVALHRGLSFLASLCEKSQQSHDATLVARFCMAVEWHMGSYWFRTVFLPMFGHRLDPADIQVCSANCFFGFASGSSFNGPSVR